MMEYVRRPSSAGARSWASNRQGVEVPWPLIPVQKDKKNQKKPRDGSKTGRVRRKHKEQGETKNTT